MRLIFTSLFLFCLGCKGVPCTGGPDCGASPCGTHGSAPASCLDGKCGHCESCLKHAEKKAPVAAAPPCPVGPVCKPTLLGRPCFLPFLCPSHGEPCAQP